MRHLGRCGWLLALILFFPRPGYALPKWAREYRVTCQTCHTVPPRLNYFGLAFQANYFNWPTSRLVPRSPRKRLSATTLVSGMVTTSVEANRTEGKTTADFRHLELFAADGFRVGGQRPGGYAIDVIAATTEVAEHGEDEHGAEPQSHPGIRPQHAGGGGEASHGGGAGSLEYAYVSLPVVGQRGQWALTAGQVNPIVFQYSPHNTFIHEHQPSALGEIDAFSFTEAAPGLRLDYYDRRGRGTADGNYLTLEVPLEGSLAFNRDADVGGPRGVFAHAFHRVRMNSLGAFGFTHSGNHLEGVMGTYEVTPGLYLLGIAAIGRDEEGSTRRLSLETDYAVNPRLALTGRVEFVGGSHDDIAPVAAVTYYPFELPLLRLTAEAVERRGERLFTFFARGQF